jgi:chorismate mutase
MLESHCCPEKALSDAKQQITPGQLQDLVKSLEFRQSYSDNIEFKNHLEQLRAQVDSIDAQVIELLTSRMKLVEKIGLYKKANNIAIVQVRRWNEIMSTSLTRAKKSGLSTTFLSKVLGAIHQESIRKQTVIFKRKK